MIITQRLNVDERGELLGSLDPMTKFWLSNWEAKYYARTVYPFRFGYGSTRKMGS
jgi:hypothetical protein